MAFRKPLVVGTAGLVEELQSGDTIFDNASEVFNMTSGAAVAQYDFVYIAATGKVSPAKADAIGTARAVGMALEAAVGADVVIKVQVDGLVGGLSGMTMGAAQFLSAATAGQRTETPPTATGNCVQVLGTAMSATEMELNFGEPIKRT